ncbi:MAG TPA: MaoC/PaaZ C-terminal domain-containing protein [Marmoricola sp.]|jgi:acyl dehydratase|nr:MaoC/PaaZ C-terminal domain-containing protein [Marmoricola sp.]
MPELEPRTYRVTRADLAAYAAASGDHNPIHADEDVAVSVGLPGVIAHGMYTLALAARYVDEWTGEPGRIVEIGAKFTRPVVVPAGAEGAEVTIAGASEERDGVTTVALRVTCGEDKVLGNPRVVLRG